MIDKHSRIIKKVLTLDRINHSATVDVVDDETKLKEGFDWYENHYGLKIHDDVERVHIIIDYTNIIWNYRVYFGSYKKRYKQLTKDDERWIEIEATIRKDLKEMGIGNMTEVVLNKLMNEEHFECHEKYDVQFKKYFIKEENYNLENII